MKRLLDITVAAVGLVLASPILLPVMFLVWRQDGHSPFYLAPRVARGGGTFTMIKLRSMVKNADRSGVDSTAVGDMRITPVGHFIRHYKLDEVTQFWNVLKGDMSLVGPRPNTRISGVDLYTPVERELLTVRPGITDFSSIIFSDEGDILAGKSDPDLSYNQLIRPWKSRLGLFYIAHCGIGLDLQLIFFTAVAIFSKPRALEGICKILMRLKAPSDLIAVSRRDLPLIPTPPPGAADIVCLRTPAS
jgi:lipopolysaccharide/colanic/teichoic acid biosynthesis glycosyltransferase